MNSQDFSYPRSTVYAINGPDGAGSGVMIGENLMITAFHVTGEEGRDMLVNGKPIKVLRFDRSADLALLEVQVSCPCIPLNLDVPRQDERVIAVGFPLGVGQVVSEGRYQDIYNDKLLSNILIAFGNSGGGLFTWNGYHWVLSGITVQVAGANIGFMGIPVWHITSSVPARFIHELIVRE
jgi:S1-C subfamily serine protease